MGEPIDNCCGYVKPDLILKDFVLPPSILIFKVGDLLYLFPKGNLRTLEKNVAIFNSAF